MTPPDRESGAPLTDALVKGATTFYPYPTGLLDHARAMEARAIRAEGALTATKNTALDTLEWLRQNHHEGDGEFDNVITRLIEFLDPPILGTVNGEGSA